MNAYFNKWTFSRAIQLIVGVYFLSDYLSDGSGMFPLVFGGIMTFQAVMNVGCFSSKGCSTNIPQSNKNDSTDSDPVEYEIV